MGKNKTFLYWLPAVIWMAVIFCLSSIKGSGVHTFDLFYFIERKTFHVIEYFLLTIFMALGFLRSFPKKRPIMLSAAAAFLYACSDEFHQTFVFGREGLPRDILIDLIGIIIASIIISQFLKWRKKKQLS